MLGLRVEGPVQLKFTFGEAMVQVWKRWLPLAVIMVWSVAHAQNIGWQEAISRLARERSAAEVCLSVLRNYGDAAAKARGELIYGEAKAEYDQIITILTATLSHDEPLTSLPDLQARLQRAFERRQAFCESVQSLLPESAHNAGVPRETEGAQSPTQQSKREGDLELWPEVGDGMMG